MSPSDSPQDVTMNAIATHSAKVDDIQQPPINKSETHDQTAGGDGTSNVTTNLNMTGENKDVGDNIGSTPFVRMGVKDNKIDDVPLRMVRRTRGINDIRNPSLNDQELLQKTTQSSVATVPPFLDNLLLLHTTTIPTFPRIFHPNSLFQVNSPWPVCMPCSMRKSRGATSSSTI